MDEEKSLWQYIVQYAPAAEQSEIKRIVGNAAVDQAEMLHMEVKMLLDIWHEYRQETDVQSAAHVQSKEPPKPAFLAEPPMIRDNLKREILFFVKSLAEKGNTSAEKVASTDVLEYALADEQAASHGRGAVAGEDGPPTASSRPRTASVDGRTVPVRPASGSRGGSRGSVGSRCSTSDSFEEKAGSLNDSINVYDVETVVGHLRETLEEECENLLQDVDFLQACLQDEHDYRHAVLAETRKAGATPSIQALRQCRSKLEKAYLDNADKAVVGGAARRRSGGGSFDKEKRKGKGKGAETGNTGAAAVPASPRRLPAMQRRDSSGEECDSDAPPGLSPRRTRRRAGAPAPTPPREGRRPSGPQPVPPSSPSGRPPRPPGAARRGRKVVPRPLQGSAAPPADRHPPGPGPPRGSSRQRSALANSGLHGSPLGGEQLVEARP